MHDLVPVRPAGALRQALESAYLHNPDLNAARAKVRAVEEQINIAKAGYRPTVVADADAGYNNTNLGITGNSLAALQSPQLRQRYRHARDDASARLYARAFPAVVPGFPDGQRGAPSQGKRVVGA
jgi:outer membrane protein TolC